MHALVGTTFAAVALYGVPRGFVLADNVHQQEQSRLGHSVDLVAVALTERQRTGSPITKPFLDGLLEEGEGLLLVRDSGSRVVVGTPADGQGDITRTREVEGVGTVELMRSGGQVDAMVTDAIVPLALLGLVLLLLSALAGTLLARRLSRPFQELADAARELGTGHFDLEVHHYGVPEAEAIGDALRGAAGQLDALVGREREFAVNASHQLRTPLAGLRLELEDLSMWPQTPPDVAEQLTMSLADVDRLAVAVDRLLESERNHRSRSTGDTELFALVGDTLDRWRPQVQAAGREIELEPGCAGGLGHVPGEVVESALDVLVGNALRHGMGRIDVDVTELPSHVRICVADEGIRSSDSDVLHRPPGQSPDAGELARAAELVESVGGYLRSAKPSTRR